VLKLLIAASVALSTLATSAPASAGTPTDEKITASFAAVNGSGCPLGSVTVVPYPDNSGIILSYSRFYVQRGGDSTVLQGYQNCNLDIRVHVPAGFTFAVSRAVYQGYAYVLPGATARLVAKYNFQGQGPTVSSHQINDGALFDDNWTIIDEFPYPSLSWSPCGQDVILTDAYELRAQPYGPSDDPSDVSFVTANKSDHSLRTELNFVWAACS